MFLILNPYILATIKSMLKLSKNHKTYDQSIKVVGCFFLLILSNTLLLRKAVIVICHIYKNLNILFLYKIYL